MFARVSTRLAAAAVAAVPLTLVAAAAPAHAQTMQSYTFSLNALKGSDAHGTATVTAMSNGDLKVKIHATGMVPNMPHAQHIHGDTSGHRFFCPTAAADSDQDGFITVEEGLPMYGNINISLTTKGDTSPKSGLAVDRMPTADADGVLDYARTIPADQLPNGTAEALHNLHIVQHGVDANGNDEYDLDGLGESTFAKSLGVKGVPAEATDAASCGMLMPTGSVDTGGETTAGVEHRGLLGGGVVAIVGAIGAFVARRRAASISR